MKWITGAGATFIALSITLLGCSPDDTKTPRAVRKACPPLGTSAGGTTSSSTSTGSSGDITPPSLAARQINYTEALRTASFKLLGNAPTLDQIEGLRQAQDPKTVYETYISQFMTSPRFPAMMIRLWKNTFRTGGAAMGNVPNRDGAAHFAAKLTAEGGDYRLLFTATSGTCPTFEPTAGLFTAADCPNGPVTAGVLTDAGLQYQYTSALAFRRVRFIQETFACSKMPAEFQPDPIKKGVGYYTTPWPFESIGDVSNGGRIAFQDTSVTICANCHATMNHRAPLFAPFDDNGTYVDPIMNANGVPQFSVIVPIENDPSALLTDYLSPGETTAWKFGKPAATLLDFGQQMAQDDEVARCAAVRAWNFAFSKGDAVYDVSDVADSVIDPLVEKFKNDGYSFRNVVRAVFVHDDFVRY